MFDPITASPRQFEARRAQLRALGTTEAIAEWKAVLPLYNLLVPALW